MSKRKFSREFKLSAVQLVNQKGYSISEAARSLGVDPSCVRYWIEKRWPRRQLCRLAARRTRGSLIEPGHF